MSPLLKPVFQPCSPIKVEHIMMMTLFLFLNRFTSLHRRSEWLPWGLNRRASFPIFYRLFVLRCCWLVMWFIHSFINIHNIQPVLRCNNCFLLLVYTIRIHPSLSTDLVDPPPKGTIYMKLNCITWLIKLLN